MLPILAAVAVIALVVVGLSQAGGKDTGTTARPFDVKRALAGLRGAPAALASLHAQANRIIDGSPRAFRARLRTLHGHPVVINKWASWCGPCRHEFPIFERVSAQRGRSVAFVGLNSGDNRHDAAEFLREFPLTYPSYEDPHERIARAVGAPSNYPITVFLDAHGRQAFIRQGGYASQRDLQRDIDRYLLGKRA